VTGNSPRLPRIPPQLHHKNTTINHRISPKPQQKHQSTTKEKKRPGNRRTAPFLSAFQENPQSKFLTQPNG
jgi:hypothetical protein